MSLNWQVSLGSLIYMAMSSRTLYATAKSTPKTLWIIRHGQAMHNPRAEAAKEAGCTYEEFLDLMRRIHEPAGEGQPLQAARCRGFHAQVISALENGDISNTAHIGDHQTGEGLTLGAVVDGLLCRRDLGYPRQFHHHRNGQIGIRQQLLRHRDRVDTSRART